MTLAETYISRIKPSPAAASAVRQYCAWQTGHFGLDFVPSAADDVDLRSYLFYLQADGATRAELKEQAAALRQFYAWANSTGVIARSPFDHYDVDQPLLAGLQDGKRPQPPVGDLQKREIERLVGLAQIAEALNKSVDIQEAIDNTLRVLLDVMNLQTGWVSMLTGSHLSIFPTGDSAAPAFTLAASFGLPPALEREDRRFLRQPPACHCQQLLAEGRLMRAVNIVECTRLQNSSLAGGDNQGLRFHASVPLISQGKPVGLINVATNDWQSLAQADLHFLTAVSEQLVIALERAHLYEIAERRRLSLEEELQVAREVQSGLMPHQMPAIPGYSLAFAWYPAREVGGDFYNIFPLDQGRWGLVIGDVVGKGTAAALYMTMIHSLILSGMLRNPSPSSVIKEVNLSVLKQISSVMFVSVFLAVLDPVKHTFRYVNAGHNPPLVRRASGILEELSGTGAVVGLFKDQNWSEGEISLGDGDAIVLYTDGVTEAKSLMAEFYSEERLYASTSVASGNANDLLAHLESDLKSFTLDETQQDDITILVVSKD